MQRRVIVATSGPDARKALIGTSPALGDLAYVGLLIPQDPTPGQLGRTLLRLAVCEVPDGYEGRVLDIGQLLTVAAPHPMSAEQLGEAPPPREGQPPHLLLERPVETPFWSFADGNVSWHLRVQRQGTRKQLRVKPPISGYSADAVGTTAAVLVDQDAFPPAAYVPPLQAQVPGLALGDLGCFHDLRYPWQSSSAALVPELVAKGPCLIVFYASVHQTDPATRPQPAPWIDPVLAHGLTAEDQFVLSLPESRYHRIAGRLTVELRAASACQE